MLLAWMDPFLGGKWLSSQLLSAVTHHLDPTPYLPPNPGALASERAWHLPLALLCPPGASFPCQFLLPLQRLFRGAQCFLTSQEQKCLYVGVCLRNNRLLFIKAPFILFAGMCFLGSRGWDAPWSPGRDATANFQGCAGAGGGVCRGHGMLRTSAQGSAFSRPACILSAERFFLPNTFLCGFPCTGAAKITGIK